MRKESAIIRSLTTIAIVLGLLMPMSLAVAGDECEPEWQPFIADGEIGVDDSVRAMTVWEGDLIVGGWFTEAGGEAVNYIARWDGEAWHPLASGGETGVNDHVRAMTVWEGDLIVGGDFTTAGGQVVDHIARWDGEEWHPFVDDGVTGVSSHISTRTTVNDLMVWRGDLIVGGFFLEAGDRRVNQIARWRGGWHTLGMDGEVGMGGMAEAAVHTLAEWNGDLVVGGRFNTAGGELALYIARWNGSTWFPFEVGDENGIDGHNIFVTALTVWNGDLIVGGNFGTSHGKVVGRILRWDGSAWRRFESGGRYGVNGWVRDLAVWDGDLILGGSMTNAGGDSVGRIVRWDGEGWGLLTGGGSPGMHSTVRALTLWDGELIVGGDFTWAGDHVTLNHITSWQGCPDPCIADWNGDGEVDVNDFFAYLSDFEDGDPRADLNDDGEIDINDFFLFLDEFEKGC